jgi:prefoldin alpha subunit
MGELEKIVQELQLIRARGEAVQERMEAATADLMQLQTTIIALNSLGSVKVGTEALIPMGSGVFIRGSLKDLKGALVDLGAGVMSDKTVVETAEGLKEKKAQLEIVRNGFERELKDLSEKNAFLSVKAQKLMQKKQETV